MKTAELLELAFLLEDALSSFEAGESYAHHAREPVERALAKLTAAMAAKEMKDGHRYSPTH